MASEITHGAVVASVHPGAVAQIKQMDRSFTYIVICNKEKRNVHKLNIFH